MLRIAGSRRVLTLALAGAAALALASCGDVDSTMFGDDNAPAASADAAAAPSAPASTTTTTTETTTTTGAPGTLPAATGTSVAVGPGVTITPIVIEAGTDTGTAVGQKTAQLRGDLSDIEAKVVTYAQQLGDLRGQAAASTGAYHEAKAQISTRLQIGTTRGNPELVAQWNSAQSSLDSLTANINSLNALGMSISNDASRAHFDLQTIQATYNISGAVDEDHRQLSVLEDETDQTIVLIDRLMTQLSDTVQRQAAYVANERSSLTTLAGAIREGELYGAELGSPMSAGSSPPPMYGVAPGGAPLVTIRFDHSDTKYKQILYSALSQALQSRPGAGFDVVGVSPTRGTASAVQLAQTSARRHAQDVMRAITDMGVPAARLGISSATDPAVTNSEVRVYIR